MIAVMKVRKKMGGCICRLKEREDEK